jgi:hypothetical protein
VQGSVYKRCTCPARRDARGRKLACGKAHGSWSYSVDAPAVAGERRRQITKGGFPTKKAAEAALNEVLSKAGRGELATPRRGQTTELRRRPGGKWLPIGSAGAPASEPACSVLAHAIRTVRVVGLVGVNCRARCVRGRTCM